MGMLKPRPSSWMAAEGSEGFDSFKWVQAQLLQNLGKSWAGKGYHCGSPCPSLLQCWRGDMHFRIIIIIIIIIILIICCCFGLDWPSAKQGRFSCWRLEAAVKTCRASSWDLSGLFQLLSCNGWAEKPLHIQLLSLVGAAVVLVGWGSRMGAMNNDPTVILTAHIR